MIINQDSKLELKLPQNVDMCSLVVSIRAGNSAGMSSPTEIEVGRSYHVLNHNKLKHCFFHMQNVPLQHVSTSQTALLQPALELMQPHWLSLLSLNKEITWQH